MVGEREKEARKEGRKEGWTEEKAKGQTNTRKTRRDGLEDRQIDTCTLLDTESIKPSRRWMDGREEG